MGLDEFADRTLAAEAEIKGLIRAVQNDGAVNLSMLGKLQADVSEIKNALRWLIRAETARAAEQHVNNAVDSVIRAGERPMTPAGPLLPAAEG